jgi:hypothetical protein
VRDASACGESPHPEDEQRLGRWHPFRIVEDDAGLYHPGGRKERVMTQDMKNVSLLKRASRANGAAKTEDSVGYSTKLVIHLSRGTVMPPVDEIDYFTSAANYVQIYSASMVYRTRSTMKGIEQHLDPQKFDRIHRCTIVNFDRVNACCSAARGDYVLILNDGTQLKMSRRHRQQLSRIVAMPRAASKRSLKYRADGGAEAGTPPSSVKRTQFLDKLALMRSASHPI